MKLAMTTWFLVCQSFFAAARLFLFQPVQYFCSLSVYTVYIRNMVFRVVFLNPIYIGKLNQIRVNQVSVCCILIGQSNNTNSFDWLDF